jgi:hypothetical protein
MSREWISHDLPDGAKCHGWVRADKGGVTVVVAYLWYSSHSYLSYPPVSTISR